MAITEIALCRKREHKNALRRKTRPAYGTGAYHQMMERMTRVATIQNEARIQRLHERAEKRSAVRSTPSYKAKSMVKGVKTFIRALVRGRKGA